MILEAVLMEPTRLQEWYLIPLGTCTARLRVAGSTRTALVVAERYSNFHLLVPHNGLRPCCTTSAQRRTAPTATVQLPLLSWTTWGISSVQPLMEGVSRVRV